MNEVLAGSAVAWLPVPPRRYTSRPAAKPIASPATSAHTTFARDPPPDGGGGLRSGAPRSEVGELGSRSDVALSAGRTRRRRGAGVSDIRPHRTHRERGQASSTIAR